MLPIPLRLQVIAISAEQYSFIRLVQDNIILLPSCNHALTRMAEEEEEEEGDRPREFRSNIRSTRTGPSAMVSARTLADCVCVDGQ
jgi:hypothetical protein